MGENAELLSRLAFASTRQSVASGASRGTLPTLQNVSHRMISENMETAVPVIDVSFGNAVDEGSQAGRQGWFIGHFVAPRAGPAATDMVEVKWGVHAAGETKAIEGVNQTATTMSLLVSGRFRLVFPRHGQSVTLARAGDYAVWSPGVSHRWRVLEDAVVITVRWPSRPDDQSEFADQPRPAEGG
jgi:hypothetical protein